MENIREINEKIAKNLIYYRKSAGLTQAELAEKINYSDKSVSKWESGGGVPDIYILTQLADLYGVSIDSLVGRQPKVEISSAAEKKKKTRSHAFVMLLSSGLVWLVATCVFVGLLLWKEDFPAWISFLYAVWVNAILLIVYSGVWKYRLLNFISVSVLIWGAITCTYITIDEILIANGLPLGALWCVFLLGAPLQILETLWVYFRSIFKKNEQKPAKK